MKVFVVVCSLFCLICFSACSDSSDETVDFNEISNREKQKEKEVEDSKSDSIPNQKPNESIFLYAFDSIYPTAKWIKWDTLLFVDRFRPKSTEKWILVNEKDSLNLCSYAFKDSIQTRNAFFNWLDCFGKNKLSLAIGSPVKIKGRSCQILISSTNILVVESIKPINQLKLIKSLNYKVKGINYLYLVDAPLGKKTTWSKMKKNELLKLERNDKNR